MTVHITDGNAVHTAIAALHHEHASINSHIESGSGSASERTETSTGAQKGKRKRSGKGSLVAGILIMVLGTGLLLYPMVAQLLSAHSEVESVATYDRNTERMSAAQKASMLQSAREYNDRVCEGKTPIHNLGDSSYATDTDYMAQLNVSDVMGSVHIPSISVNLPIYHGTQPAQLNVGAGHLYGTSLPVGGKGSNAVLAGHRGLPSALIFTRLDELNKGDYFYVEVLGEQLWYKVDAIWVTSPEDISHFGIDPQRDVVTLLTCTPYGVNTERLLVQGVRTQAPRSMPQDEGVYPAGLYAALVTAAGLIIMVPIVRMHSRRTVSAIHWSGK